MVRSYVQGFVFSLILTLCAYFATVLRIFTGQGLLVALGVLAVAQALVQLLFFFHLEKKESPPWKLFVFLFMLLIAAIIVVLTIWIMYNLDYRMMPKMEM